MIGIPQFDSLQSIRVFVQAGVDGERKLLPLELWGGKEEPGGTLSLLDVRRQKSKGEWAGAEKRKKVWEFS